jgi:hypothetical protein
MRCIEKVRVQYEIILNSERNHESYEMSLTNLSDNVAKFVYDLDTFSIAGASVNVLHSALCFLPLLSWYNKAKERIVDTASTDGSVLLCL